MTIFELTDYELLTRLIASILLGGAITTLLVLLVLTFGTYNKLQRYLNFFIEKGLLKKTKVE